MSKKATKTSKAPLSLGSTYVPKFKIRENARGNLDVMGEELLEDIKAFDADECNITPINPVNWVSTKVCNQAKLHSYWKVKKLRFHVITNSSASTAGSIAVGFFASGDDIASDNTETFRALTMTKGGGFHSVWKNARYDYPVELINHRFWSCQGIGNPETPIAMLGAVALDTGKPNGISVARISVEYEFEFSSPRWDIGGADYTTGINTTTLVAGTLSAGGGGTETITGCRPGSVMVIRENTDMGDVRVHKGTILKAVDWVEGTATTVWRLWRAGQLIIDLLAGAIAFTYYKRKGEL